MRLASDLISERREPEQSIQAESIGGLAGEWDALCDQVGASIFLRPGWFSCWWDAFGTGSQEVVVVRREGELAGVLPLLRSRTALLSQTNWHSVRFGPVTADRSAEQLLVDDTLARAQPCGRLDLGFLAEDDPAVARIAGSAERKGFRTIVRTTERSPVVALDGDWETFENELPSKRRSDLRRRQRRLGEQGELSFECEDGTERLDDLLAEGIAVEEAGWDGRGGTPIAARPDTRVFYRRIADWAVERDYLRLFFLRLDGRAVAFAFCLVDGDSLCVLKLGFHPSQARLAPGLLLTRKMLAHSFAAEYRSYEFLGHAEPYKMIWTDQCRERVRVQAFPSTATGLASYVAWKRVRPLAKWALAAAPGRFGA